MDAAQRMLQEIEREAELTAPMTGRAHIDPRVARAMLETPREAFVPDELRHLAYVNEPLSIGYGQTISQPFIVALMTDLLEPQPGDRVLEIGTGSGYQAAVLAKLVATVYSQELIPELAEQAAERLRRLGYDNVHVRRGDGYDGWAEHSPFDGIIVTAAAEAIPAALEEQLAPGGRLVIPIGRPHAHQDLVVASKDHDGRIAVRELLGVAFVPLVRGSDDADG